MIVYNVKRRFYAQKADADAYRKGEGLKPSALSKLVVNSREELAALLTALCEPQESGGQAVKGLVPATVLDAAYVPPSRDVPAFIREGWEKWRERNARTLGLA